MKIWNARIFNVVKYVTHKVFLLIQGLSRKANKTNSDEV